MEKKQKTSKKGLIKSKSDDSVIKNKKRFLSKKRSNPYVNIMVKTKRKKMEKITTQRKMLDNQRKMLDNQEKDIIEEQEKDALDHLTNDGRKYLKLLNSLLKTAQPLTQKPKKIDVISLSKISHDFQTEMDVDEFLATLEKLIKVIKKIWTTEEKANAHKDLYKGVIAVYISDDNSPIFQLKWDLILSVFSDSYYDSKFVNTITLLNKDDLIPFPNVDNGIDKISKYLNKNVLTEFLLSKALVSVYCYVLKHRVNCTGISEESVREKIIELLNKIQIFFCDLDESLAGLTIYTGNVFIKKRYYSDYLRDNDNSVPLAVILTTIYHEFMHILFRSFRDTSNYYTRTETKTIDSKEYDDSGSMVDHYLIDSILEYYTTDSDYLLNKDSYLVDFQDFRRGLIKSRNKSDGKKNQKPYKAKIIRVKFPYIRDGCKYSHSH